MKINELERLGIHTDYIESPQAGFYDASGHYQEHPEQCPQIVDEVLVAEGEDGELKELELIKHRSEKATCEAVFLAGGFFWTWEENNAFDGWTATEDEPEDDWCPFMGEWINENKMKTMKTMNKMNEKIEIKTGFLVWNILEFGETEGIDIDRTVELYADQLKRAILAEFPEADVEVDWQFAGGCVPIPLQTRAHGLEHDHREEEWTIDTVDDICAEVFSRGEFYVLEQQTK